MEINRNSLMYHIVTAYGFAPEYDNKSSVSMSEFFRNVFFGILFILYIIFASVYIGYSLLSLVFWAMMAIQYDAVLPFDSFCASGVIVMVAGFIWFVFETIATTIKELKKSSKPKTVTFTGSRI